jgi:hypothetical protein
MPEPLRPESEPGRPAAEELSKDFALRLSPLLDGVEFALNPVIEKALSGKRGSVSAQMSVVKAIWLFNHVQKALVNERPSLHIPGLARHLQDAHKRIVELVGAEKARAWTAYIQAPDRMWLAQFERRLGRLRHLNLLGVPGSLSESLESAFIRWSLNIKGESPIDLVDDVAVTAGIQHGYAQALFDTYCSIYGRLVEAEACEGKPDDQPFLFSGPVDGHTRDWCLNHVGKVYTRRQIEAMNNEQLPNAFLTGGGYNCRHTFLAVHSSELVALCGTDQRAPEFEAEIASALAQRDQARIISGEQWWFTRDGNS